MSSSPPSFQAGTASLWQDTARALSQPLKPHLGPPGPPQKKRDRRWGGPTGVRTGPCQVFSCSIPALTLWKLVPPPPISDMSPAPLLTIGFLEGAAAVRVIQEVMHRVLLMKPILSQRWGGGEGDIVTSGGGHSQLTILPPVPFPSSPAGSSHTLQSSPSPHSSSRCSADVALPNPSKEKSAAARCK